MKNTPFNLRNNEFYGDLEIWMRAHARDNESDLRRLKRNLRLAREQELTARQKEMLRLRFEEGLTITEIAERLEVNKSTVSRTIARAKKRIYKCLRYTL